MDNKPVAQKGMKGRAVTVSRTWKEVLVYLNFRGSGVVQSEGVAVRLLFLARFTAVGAGPEITGDAFRLVCEHALEDQWEKKSRLTHRDLLSGLWPFQRTFTIQTVKTGKSVSTPMSHFARGNSTRRIGGGIGERMGDRTRQTKQFPSRRFATSL